MWFWVTVVLWALGTAMTIDMDSKNKLKFEDYLVSMCWPLIAIIRIVLVVRGSK